LVLRRQSIPQWFAGAARCAGDLISKGGGRGSWMMPSHNPCKRRRNAISSGRSICRMIFMGHDSRDILITPILTGCRTPESGQNLSWIFGFVWSDK
jgi:hypothetical protein